LKLFWLAALKHTLRATPFMPGRKSRRRRARSNQESLIELNFGLTQRRNAAGKQNDGEKGQDIFGCYLHGLFQIEVTGDSSPL
jgi:hypothetical protein